MASLKFHKVKSLPTASTALTGNIYFNETDKTINICTGTGWSTYKGTDINTWRPIGTGANDAAAGNHAHTFASLTSKPTTLSGYGITDAPTKSGSGATGTWGISISGNAATATKVGTSTVGSTTMPVYIKSGTPTAITSFPEAYLSWGGTNIRNDVSPIDAACCDEFGHNKLAFLPADCITAEYTTDGGSTWLDYGASDAQKIALVTYSAGTSFDIGKGLASSKDGTMTNSNCSNYQVRITISSIDSSGAFKLYTNTKKLLINFSANGASGCKVKVETQTVGNYSNNIDTWSTVGDYDVYGWTGWNSIPLPLLFGAYGLGQPTNIVKLRLTLSITTVSTTYSSIASIKDLRLIGISNHINPSTMSTMGHLYSFDTSQNATFPAAVKSAKFIKSGGTSSQFLKADGSVDSSTYTKSGHTHTGSEVKLTGYSKASSYSAIAASDTVNQAIGKLEGAISGLEDLLASI